MFAAFGLFWIAKASSNCPLRWLVETRSVEPQINQGCMECSAKCPRTSFAFTGSMFLLWFWWFLRAVFVPFVSFLRKNHQVTRCGAMGRHSDERGGNTQMWKMFFGADGRLSEFRYPKWRKRKSSLDFNFAKFTCFLVIATSKAGEGRQETVDRHLHRVQYYGLTLCASYNITMVHRFKIHSWYIYRLGRFM